MTIIATLLLTSILILWGFRIYWLEDKWMSICHSLNLSSSSSKEIVLKEIKKLRN